MPVRKPALLTLASLSLALSTPALAKTIYHSGDWSLDDSLPGVQGKGNCVAATATYLGNYGAYSLNVVLDKSGTHPIEIMIRPFRSPSKAERFRVTIDSGLTYTFVKLPRSAKGEDTFWNLPRDTSKFIAQLKVANQLNIDAAGDMGELPFSLIGATAVLNKLAKLCVASPAMDSADFERSFLPQEVNNVDFSKLDQAKASLIRDIVTKGADAYRNFDKMKAQLSALEARYGKLSQEKSALTGALDQLSNRDFPALIRARSMAQANIEKANADIATLKSSLVNQDSLLAVAQAAYEVAAVKIKPFLPEHNRLEAIKQNNEQRQAKAESGLAAAGQELASKAQELADRKAELENRHDQMDSRARDIRQYVIPNLQEEIGSLQAQRSARSSELSSARSALAESAEALRKYEAVVSFAELTTEVQKASGRLSSIEQEIAKLKSLVANREQLIAEQNSLRESLTAEIASANKAIQEKVARLAEVKQSLLSYPADHKAAEGNIDKARNALSEISRELAAQLSQAAKH